LGAPLHVSFAFFSFLSAKRAKQSQKAVAGRRLYNEANLGGVSSAKFQV